jgi:hypothetical protein
MNRQHGQKKMPTMAAITSSAMAVALLLATATVGPQPAWAADAQVAHRLVEQARLTLDGFQADPQMGSSLRALVRKAKGVMIYPQVLRGVLSAVRAWACSWCGTRDQHLGGLTFTLGRRASPGRGGRLRWCRRLDGPG